jgi:hypothetical protein
VDAEIEEADVEPDPDDPPAAVLQSAPSSLVAERVLFFIRAKPALRSEEVRSALRLRRMDMQKAVRWLLVKGRITKEQRAAGDEVLARVIVAARLGALVEHEWPAPR